MALINHFLRCDFGVLTRQTITTAFLSIFIAITQGCDSNKGQPSGSTSLPNSISPYNGIWLHEDNSGPESPSEMILIIDSDNYASIYECKFLEFELSMTPRMMDQSNSFNLDPDYVGEDIKSRKVTVALDNEKITASIQSSSSMPGVNSNESEVLIFEKVGSIPNECLSESLEVEITSISPGFAILGQNLSYVVEYSYRIVDTDPGELRAALSVSDLNSPSTGFSISSQTVESSALGSGEVVRDTFIIEVPRESWARATAGDYIELNLGFYKEYNDQDTIQLPTFKFTEDSSILMLVWTG